MNFTHTESSHTQWASAQKIKPLPSKITDKQQARFWKKVDKSGGPDACWPWTGWNQGGYGTVKIARVAYRVHRIAYQISNADDIGENCVCHRCDNSICCNPAHLFSGTIVENIIDMVKKKRHGHGKTHSSITRIECRPRGDRNGSRTHPEKVPKGEAHSMHKLTEGDVLEIRRLYASGTTRKELVAMFGVTKGNIAFIVNRETWRHI